MNTMYEKKWRDGEFSSYQLYFLVKATLLIGILRSDIRSSKIVTCKLAPGPTNEP